uniref:Uncharacterized protein n=1 Tax=Oryza sativa subsp. japonica TaxID=39947 RepID=Q6Z683_ORYSJ|nr:hypothetical protein [Oryza sativa Japonica Group]
MAEGGGGGNGRGPRWRLLRADPTAGVSVGARLSIHIHHHGPSSSRELVRACPLLLPWPVPPLSSDGKLDGGGADLGESSSGALLSFSLANTPVEDDNNFPLHRIEWVKGNRGEACLVTDKSGLRWTKA